MLVSETVSYGDCGVINMGENGDFVQGSYDLHEQYGRLGASANGDEDGDDAPIANDKNDASEQNGNGNETVVLSPNATSSHDISTGVNSNAEEAQDAPELEIDSQVSSVVSSSCRRRRLGLHDHRRRRVIRILLWGCRLCEYR